MRVSGAFQPRTPVPVPALEATDILVSGGVTGIVTIRMVKDDIYGQLWSKFIELDPDECLKLILSLVSHREMTLMAITKHDILR